MNEEWPSPPTLGLPFGIQEFRIANFRAVEEAACRLSTFNVIAGVNGSGKTSILRSLAFLLEGIVRRVGPRPVAGQRPTPFDFWQGGMLSDFFAQIVDEGTVQGMSRKWHLVDGKVFGISRIIPNGAANSDIAMRYWTGLVEEKLGLILPVMCFYPVERAVGDVPLRIRAHDPYSRRSGYDRAFTSQRNFRSFFEWFRDQEDAENEHKDLRYRDPVLTAVRNAIEAAMPGYKNLRIERRPRLRMLIDKDGEDFAIQQLSDGERGILALVGDLAKRAALLNPDLKNPCLSPGCVLIDEIDLHLHPQWQRHLVKALPKVFPNIQFVCATHSPIVCGSVDTDSLLILEHGRVKSAKVYGWSVADILKRVFDVSDRPESTRHDLDELDRALDDGDLPLARSTLERLRTYLPPDDPEIVRANVVLPFLAEQANHA